MAPRHDTKTMQILLPTPVFACLNTAHGVVIAGTHLSDSTLGNER